MDREGLESSHEPAPPAPAAAIGPALAPAPFSGPGGAGPDLGSLAALPPPARAAAFARLQRGAGNYAVSRAVLARVEDSDLAAKHEEGERQRMRDLGIDFDLERADDTTKLDAIRRLMPNQEAVRILWNSFGARQGEVAMANKDLFEQCLKRDHSVLNLPGWTDKRNQFKEAVEGRMLDNLATNRRVVTTEMEKLGVAGENKPPTREQDAYLRETQLLAEHVQRALMGMQAAKSIKVGRDYETIDSVGGSSKTEEGDAYFDPRRPPHKPMKGEGYTDYNEVKLQYELLDSSIQRVLQESPSVFALVGDAGGLWPDRADVAAAGGLAGADPKQAREQLRPALTGLATKIDEAVPLVGGDLDHRDCIPVHQQLMQTPEWSGEVEKVLIEQIVEGHEANKMLVALGLGALSAAGFIVANLATGGLATFLAVATAVGASGLQAGISIEHYLDVAKAREARTGDTRRDIVSEGQVDAALFQAVVDTALAFIDAASGVSQLARLGSRATMLVKAAEAGAEASASAALKEAMAAGASGAGPAVERAFRELGLQETMRQSGKTAAELAEIVGRETPLGKEIATAAELGAEGLQDVMKKLKDLAGLGSDAERIAVMRQAIDQMGYARALDAAGGWKAVTGQLGAANPITVELERWRSQLVESAQRYIESTAEGATARRTGTPSGTSDVDVSTFGKDAAQNVENLKEHIAQQAGIDRKQLEKILDADAAVDPTRMHLHDVAPGISAETHAMIDREAARHQEALIYSRRFHDAGGDVAIQEQVRREAAANGVKINEAYKPLTAAEISALERRMDGWAKQLEALGEGGSEAERKRLIEQIGRAQAEALASNPNMYGTGGSIRSWVTERMDPEKGIRDREVILDALGNPQVRGGLTWPAQRYTAILGEGTHLDHALAGIRRTGGDPGDLMNALKSFGKHGERVTQILGRDVAGLGVTEAELADLARELRSYVERYKNGELAKDVAPAAVEAMRAKVTAQAERLNAAIGKGTKALRDQAALGAALTPAEIAGMNAWVHSQAAAQAARDALLADLHAVAQQMRVGATFPAALPEIPAPSAPPPAADDEGPNQSVEPEPVSREPAGAPQ